MTRSEFTRYAASKGETAQKAGRNLRYYLSYWDRYAANPWFLSWNWGAFFLGGLWMLYRKMYAWGMLVLLVDFWISLQARPHFLALNDLAEQAAQVGGGVTPDPAMTAPVMALLLWWAVSLGVRLALSVLGNALYYHYAAYMLRTSRGKARGGVGLVPPILWWAGSVLYALWILPMSLKSPVVAPMPPAAQLAPEAAHQPSAPSFQSSPPSVVADDIPGAKRFFTW